jgi:hypothetical protein
MVLARMATSYARGSYHFELPLSCYLCAHVYLLWPFDEAGLRRKVGTLLGIAASGIEHAQPSPASATAARSVLVAEDNVVNQRLIGAILGKGGHRFEIAADGLQCVQAFCRGQFDLVLMDMQMPGMDGFLTKPIRPERMLAAIAEHAAAGLQP